MPLINFGIVDDFTWRSGQPDAQGIMDLKKLGCKSIIKLNIETPEEAQWCSDYGIKLIQMPIPTFVNDVANIQSIATELRNQRANGIALVHCEHGRDRTGLVVGAYRVMFEGWTVEQANAERQEYGVEGIIKLFDMDMDIILAQIYGSVHP